jgi:phage terminase small subunit
MRKTDDDIILKMLEEGHTQKEIAEHFGVSPAAICKRVKRLEAYPKSINDLTPQQQRFVQSIAEGKSQTQSAMDAYEVSSLASAKALGSQLMKKPKIEAAVSEWMDYHGLTKDYRVQRLKKHVDNRDANVSLKALDQTWKLDNSYRETHVNVSVPVEELIQSRDDAKRRYEEAIARKAELLAIQESRLKQQEPTDVIDTEDE